MNTNRPDHFYDVLPTRLRELMKESHVSQKQLAEALGITRQSISQYCDGSSQPALNNLITIADYFNVSLDYLLGRIEVASTSINKKEICKTTGLTSKSVDILKKLQFDPKTETSSPNMLSIINTCISALASGKARSFSHIVGDKKWRLFNGVKSKIEYDPIAPDYAFVKDKRSYVSDRYTVRALLGGGEAKRYACHRIAQIVENALVQKYIGSDGIPDNDEEKFLGSEPFYVVYTTHFMDDPESDEYFGGDDY